MWRLWVQELRGEEIRTGYSGGRGRGEVVARREECHRNERRGNGVEAGDGIPQAYGWPVACDGSWCPNGRLCTVVLRSIHSPLSVFIS